MIRLAAPRSGSLSGLLAVVLMLVASAGSVRAAGPAHPGFVLPPLPSELMSPLQRLAAGPDAYGYPLQVSLPMFAVPAITLPEASIPRAWAALAALNGAILLALNLAFLGHLRRAYSSPRRRSGRRN